MAELYDSWRLYVQINAAVGMHVADDNTAGSEFYEPIHQELCILTHHSSMITMVQGILGRYLWPGINPVQEGDAHAAHLVQLEMAMVQIRSRVVDQIPVNRPKAAHRHRREHGDPRVSVPGIHQIEALGLRFHRLRHAAVVPDALSRPDPPHPAAVLVDDVLNGGEIAVKRRDLEDHVDPGAILGADDQTLVIGAEGGIRIVEQRCICFKVCVVQISRVHGVVDGRIHATNH